ncbi:hypothetical protein BFJ63_vAg18405 [Fusarium oxysporum f. sp. narcissi]|uniref:Heterokaryon incompatibility domain-containing protein n=1 Tax=Fusarium oxysporum f. sp. narcissi TaxID=451672 RepID=A0A4Q2UWJ6_FUSOX|nr:hypothetical protein BFJ63_vAg18405 [Fusarium oxysporum f. sp. narcissi]
MTTEDNLQQHKEGIYASSLPQTIQDAIIICKALKCRYLWVDALCIIQGNKQDWDRESSQMLHVYRNALVTVCAQGASDVSAGCFTSRDALSRRPVFLPTYNSLTATSTTTSCFWSRQALELGPIGPVNFRAWTLQEQTLSGRLLSYCEDSVFWFCCTSKLSEGTPYKPPVREDGLCRDFKTMVLDYELRPVSRGLRSMTSKSRQAYNGWYDLMRQYCVRNIKERTDKLVAISGLAEQMSRIVKDNYVSGLWGRDLIRGLLWKTLLSKEDETTRYPLSGEGFVAPSWSWASMKQAYVQTWFGVNFDHGILHDHLKCPAASSAVESPPVTARSDIEILSFHCQPVTDSPFGQLRSGTIQLKGYIRQYSWEAEDNRLYDYTSQTEIGIIEWDEDFPPDDAVHVVCLYMARYISSSEECEAFGYISEREQRFGKCICLGLIETGVRANEYYRVGIAEIAYWQWDTDVKKEISLI